MNDQVVQALLLVVGCIVFLWLPWFISDWLNKPLREKDKQDKKE